MLNRAPILIVEDELLIALELAILDVQLTDGDATPIADALAARGVPMVFQSAVNLPSHLQLRYPNAIFYRKLVSAERLLNTLAKMMGR